MDPLSVPALALGGVSLAFQVFSGCVKGYQLLVEADRLPETHEHLRTRLQLEQYRFLDWAVAAGLDGYECHTHSNWQLNHPALLDSLKETQSLLLSLEKLSTKYRLVLEPCFPGSQEAPLPEKTLAMKHTRLLKSALRLAAKSTTYPTRLRWVAFDGDKFEELLANLTRMNDSVLSFLDPHQKRQHHEIQESTFMTVLKVNDKMDDLKRLIQSLDVKEYRRNGYFMPNAGAPVSPSNNSHVELVQFKALNVELENKRQPEDNLAEAKKSSEVSGVKLSTQHVHFTAPSIGNESLRFRSAGSYNGNPVWVEWKLYSPGASGLPPSYMKDRISKLAILLRGEHKPTAFHTPDCFGYIDQVEEARLGFVFRRDHFSDPRVPRSLYELLAKTERPSLTARIELAEVLAISIWYLHAVNWIHKGVRSDNILFQDEGDIKNPMLSGFDFARPEKVGEVTDQAEENRQHEMYRHPDVQFDVPRLGKSGSTRLHDVYSLGVILYEIGLWQPIERVMGICGMERGFISRVDIKSVRQFLLSPTGYRKLSSEAGGRFADAVSFCLDPAAFDPLPIERKDIHEMFEEKVLEVLKSIKV
ncbi:Fc.00g022070.m01.CDS01 [Cosmosporella sp. VM-42]